MPRTKAQVRALLAPTEHAEQRAVVAWARTMEPKWPELALLFAIPNQGRAGGRQGARWGARMAEEGLRAGLPDLMLPAARQRPLPQSGSFHGVFVEMKRSVGGQLSPAQKQWLGALEAAGYFCVVAPGAAVAIRALECYLALGPAPGQLGVGPAEEVAQPRQEPSPGHQRRERQRERHG